MKSYENLLVQWKEKSCWKNIARQSQKALERDRKIRHLEPLLHTLQRSKQMYDGLLHDGGIELFASLQIKDMNPSPDSYTKPKCYFTKF